VGCRCRLTGPHAHGRGMHERPWPRRLRPSAAWERAGDGRLFWHGGGGLAAAVRPGGEPMTRGALLRFGAVGLLLGFCLDRIGFADYGEVHRMFTFACWRLFSRPSLGRPRLRRELSGVSPPTTCCDPRRSGPAKFPVGRQGDRRSIGVFTASQGCARQDIGLLLREALRAYKGAWRTHSLPTLRSTTVNAARR
jgi:hypothetical protein